MKTTMLQKVAIGGAVLGVGYLLFRPKEKKIRRHGWTVSGDCTRFHQNNFGQWSIFMENHLIELGVKPSAEAAEEILTTAFMEAFPECPSPPAATFTFAAAPGISATWDELLEQVKQVWSGLEAASQLGVMFGGVE